MNNTWRIESISYLGDEQGNRVAKIFNAFRKHGNAYVFSGQYSAPLNIDNDNLWKIAEQRLSDAKD